MWEGASGLAGAGERLYFVLVQVDPILICEDRCPPPGVIAHRLEPVGSVEFQVFAVIHVRCPLCSCLPYMNNNTRGRGCSQYLFQDSFKDLFLCMCIEENRTICMCIGVCSGNIAIEYMYCMGICVCAAFPFRGF